MLRAIYPIVEGHGDVPSIPILLRRFAHEVHENFEVHVLPAHRIPKGRMLSPRQLELAVELASRKLSVFERPVAVFVSLDSDDDCPAELGPSLLDRILDARSDLPASVVVAKREFESWLIASAVSLRGQHQVLRDAYPPLNPEDIAGAKEFLEERLMEPGASYSPTVDQPALTAAFDLNAARSCPSFEKLWRDLDRLFKL